MEAKYKVIIIDDEVKGRELIKTLLIKHTEFVIIAECSSVQEAKNIIVKENPDLLFLDIQMPESDGFDLTYQLEHLGIKIPVVFVTAYEKYMLKAFKVQPFGYLLKPVNPYDFSEVLLRFKKQNKPVTDECVNRILLTTLGGMIQVCTEDISYITITKKVAEVYLKGGENLRSNISLNKLEEVLPTNIFFRISKSAIINLNCIEMITTERELTLKNSTVKLKIGKEYFVQLKNRLTII